jgi:transposase-like protein
LPVLLKVARLSQAVLDYRGGPISPQERRAIYFAEIKRRGWVRGRQQVKWEPIVKGLSFHFHGFEPFEFSRLLLPHPSQTVSWLRSVLDTRDRVTHPFCHVLMIDFLFGSLDRFLHAVLANQVTPASPVIEVGRLSSVVSLEGGPSCRNAAAKLDCSFTTVAKQRRALSVATSERRNTLRPEVVRNVGLALARGAAMDDTARRYGISTSSVYRILAQFDAIGAARSKALLAATQSTQRKRWLDACAARPTSGVTEIRRAAAATYAWLYRHDREWLTLNRPAREVRAPAGRVEWQQRDQELARNVRRVAAEVTGARDHKALSVTSLIKAVYNETSARRHAQRLPQFWKALYACASGPACGSSPFLSDLLGNICKTGPRLA